MEDAIFEKTFLATTEQIPNVTEFVDDILASNNCPPKVSSRVDIIIDEIFSNIAQYAYQHNQGNAIVKIKVTDESIELAFADSGVVYNPLEKSDPDVTLSTEERQIGGLGIFITKKFADKIEYEHTDGKNILTISLKKN